MTNVKSQKHLEKFLRPGVRRPLPHTRWVLADGTTEAGRLRKPATTSLRGPLSDHHRFVSLDDIQLGTDSPEEHLLEQLSEDHIGTDAPAPIAVDALFALRDWMRDRGVSISALARELGTSRSAVREILNGDRTLTSEMAERVAAYIAETGGAND